MSDYFNAIPLKRFAGTAAACMGWTLPDSYAPGVDWAASILTGGKPAARTVLYHADAVPMYVWQQWPELFAPVYANTTMTLPMLSTVESVTPVAHASMYTGLDPEGHGIRTYVRPRLDCDTLYDFLLRGGLRPLIIAMEDSTFHHIFAGRDMDYVVVKNAVEAAERTVEAVASRQYDLISTHTFDYDNAAHHYGPVSKEALNAISIEAEGFDAVARAIDTTGDRTLLVYAPDHGQHDVAGGRGAHGSRQIEDMNILHFYGLRG